jgi:bromodomain-containing protein 7/9
LCVFQTVHLFCFCITDISVDKPPALKLILKVGGGSSSTPEHSDSPGPPSVSGPSGVLSGTNYSVTTLEDESSTSLLGVSPLDISGEGSKHKKAKKKKKKKDRDRDRDKHERKHKHHHKVKFINSLSYEIVHTV